MVSIETSTPKISSKRSLSSPVLQAGFTLFEILIVVAIIASLMAALLPRFRKPDVGIKKTARHLLVLGRDVRNQARLKDRTYRIAFRMDGPKHGYWVESAAGSVIPKSQLKIEEELKLPEDERPKDAFQKDEKYTKKEFELPKDFYIGLVETPSLSEGVTQGMAYVYFTPEGLVEPAAIQLTNRKDITWTLIYNPLTGHADIIEKAVRLRDLKD